MICWFEAGVTDSFGPQLAGCRTVSASCPAARARTTTARSGAGRSTSELVTRRASPPGLRSTTASARITSGRSSQRVISTSRPRAATSCPPTARRPRGVDGLAPPTCAKLREPGDDAQPDPDRRQKHVEDEVRDDDQRPPIAQ